MTIHKENVECRTRNIEYRSDESLRSSFPINGWPLRNSCNRYSILDIPAPSRGCLEPTRFMGGRFLKKGKAGWVLPLGLLNVIVKKELMWMGSQFDGIDFIIDLVVDPHVDDILGKDITLFKKRLILLQCIQCFIQGARC